VANFACLLTRRVPTSRPGSACTWGHRSAQLTAGTALEATGHHHQIDGIDGRLVPARAATDANPMPFCLMAGHRLRRDVPAGTVMTAEMVEPPPDSVL
jgi:predicted homoserine dehydrogenase-like protein